MADIFSSISDFLSTHSDSAQNSAKDFIKKTILKSRSSLGAEVAKYIIVFPVIISQSVINNHEDGAKMIKRISSGIQIRTIVLMNLFLNQIERQREIKTQTDLDNFIRGSQIFNFMNEEQKTELINSLEDKVDFSNMQENIDFTQYSRNIANMMKELHKDSELQGIVNESINADFLREEDHINFTEESAMEFTDKYSREFVLTLSRNERLMEEYTDFIASNINLRQTKVIVEASNNNKKKGGYKGGHKKKGGGGDAESRDARSVVTRGMNLKDLKDLENLNSGAPYVYTFQVNVGGKNTKNKTIPFALGVKPLVHIISSDEIVKTLRAAFIYNRLLFRSIAFIKKDINVLNFIMGFDRNDPNAGNMLHHFLVSKGRMGSGAGNMRETITSSDIKDYESSYDAMDADDESKMVPKFASDAMMTKLAGYNRILTLVIDREDALLIAQKYQGVQTLDLLRIPNQKKFVSSIGIKSLIVCDKTTLTITDHGLQSETMDIKSFGIKDKKDDKELDRLADALMRRN